MPMSQNKRANNKQPQKRRTNWAVWIMALLIVIMLGAMIWKNNQTSQSQPNPAQESAAPTVNGIRCQNMEGSALHQHAHLAIFNNGKSVPVPAEIGIPGPCMYWLHTHDATGEIHVESPEVRSFTLGDFFEIWGQPLTSNQVGQVSDEKPLRMFVDGQPYTGDPRAIPLKPHTQITLEAGPNYVDPPVFNFPQGD